MLPCPTPGASLDTDIDGSTQNGGSFAPSPESEYTTKDIGMMTGVEATAAQMGGTEHTKSPEVAMSTTTNDENDVDTTVHITNDEEDRVPPSSVLFDSCWEDNEQDLVLNKAKKREAKARKKAERKRIQAAEQAALMKEKLKEKNQEARIESAAEAQRREAEAQKSAEDEAARMREIYETGGWAAVAALPATFPALPVSKTLADADAADVEALSERTSEGYLPSSPPSIRNAWIQAATRGAKVWAKAERAREEAEIAFARAKMKKAEAQQLEMQAKDNEAEIEELRGRWNIWWSTRNQASRDTAVGNESVDPSQPQGSPVAVRT
jgi:hypothetical protein